MLIVNPMAGKAEYDKEAKPPETNPDNGVFFLGADTDLSSWSGGDLIEVYNTVVKAFPDLATREVVRFSTRPVGEARVKGLFVRVRALNNDGGKDEPEAPKPETEKENDVATKKVKKAAKPKKEKKAPGERTRKDVEVAAAAKIFPPREGSVQAVAFELLSQRGGIAVDDFVKEMKAKKKGTFTASNVWSALVYLFHTKKGYGLRRKDGKLSIFTR